MVGESENGWFYSNRERRKERNQKKKKEGETRTGSQTNQRSEGKWEGSISIVGGEGSYAPSKAGTDVPSQFAQSNEVCGF